MSGGSPAKVSVDTGTCIGSGQCVRLAPAVFAQRDEDGLVALLVARPVGPQRQDAETAAALCPSGAIRLVPPPDAGSRPDVRRFGGPTAGPGRGR
ncbi:hypothetical protein FDG2_2870 [Candidatus Protofrankia californiensis]|uniref:Ferredoxin n=1 Tax=Candidatus Protofrankia californiensis TaxID=1839754 RepID=A0A1C3NYJ4_9ACTN|nr:hypothetical protein FDG2_2870 [Candidatus Protofrankia californiensis]